MDSDDEKPVSLIIPPKGLATNDFNFEAYDISLELDLSISDLQITGNNSMSNNDAPRPLEIDSTPDNDAPILIPGVLPIVPPLVPKTLDDLIESLNHKSHPQHPLKLIFYPAFVKNRFSCAACGGDIKDDYAYRCDGCNYSLHVKCVFLPESLSNEEHDTALKLYYSPASAFGKDNTTYYCCGCWQATPKNLWVYYCRTCDYGTDTSCILVKERLKEEIYGYKDTFRTFNDRPGANEKCTRKYQWFYKK